VYGAMRITIRGFCVTRHRNPLRLLILMMNSNVIVTALYPERGRVRVMGTDNFAAFKYAAVICETIGQTYAVSPFDATRVQVITPTPAAAAEVSRKLTDAGIEHRPNGNDVIIDVPETRQRFDVTAIAHRPSAV